MRRPLHPRALLVLAALVAQAPPPAPAAEQTLDGRVFSLPDGFILERAAGPPLIDRPITADLDEQGRLYVTESSGSNDRVEVQLAERPHRILRLEDTDGDGRFDRRTVFADRMMFPEGTLWHAGSLYVAAPPSLWKLTDTDGDGVADERVEWFRGKTLTGCANDLHGPYLGPDGWVYWCKGGFARQTHERPGKPPFVTRAAHLFRCRPDGSGPEPVMTGGMDNPVDVAFTPGGEPVVSCTFLQHPGGGRRDGLVHAVYGGVFGKVHDVLDGHVRTGPDVLPALAHLGPAAPCGLTAYESAAFGDAYRDNLFLCNFNLQKVTRHVLKAAGSTFVSRDSDFLVSPDRDFHPTDVIEDADGSLLVVDTGGWYKLCCPTSQLPRPDVLGAIYRVRKVGAPRPDDPRGLALDWDRMSAPELSRALDDPRPAVRKRAVEALARRWDGSAAVVPAPGRSPEGRRNLVRAATRADDPSARRVARLAIESDDDETVRQTAIHAAGLWRDGLAVPLLLAALKAPSPPTRRAAAEALGRIGDRSAVPGLLDAAGEATDRVLEHSVTFALIEIADPDATRPGLSSPNPRTRRAAVVALDQMTGGALTPDAVAPDLASPDPAAREVASWVAGRHPEWAGALAGFYRGRLAARSPSDAEREELAGQLARFAPAEPVQALIAASLRDPSADRLAAVRAVARSGLKDVPGSWVVGLTELLAGSDPDLVRASVAAARALPISPDRAGSLPLSAALRAVGGDARAPATLRLDALAAVPGGLDDVSPAEFAFLRRRLDPESPPAERTAAAGVLARARLSTGQLVDLTDAVKAAGPLEIDGLLAAFGQTKDDAVGEKLVEALRASAAAGSLRAEVLRPRLDRFGPEVRARAEALYASLNPDAPAMKARLEAILPTLAGGDVRRGQAVFNGVKAGCLSCHAIGYLGGKVGPDLTGIGKVRTERDLLESVLYPSLSFVRSYEPVTVATRDGKVVTGLLRAESASEVVLTLNATEEARLPRDAIEDVRPGTVSVMPAGLDQVLSRQELADLIAFLKSRR